MSLAEICFCYDEECNKPLFDCFVDSGNTTVLTNSCVQCLSLPFLCGCLSHMTSVVVFLCCFTIYIYIYINECYIMYIIYYTAPTVLFQIPALFCFFRLYCLSLWWFTIDSILLRIWKQLQSLMYCHNPYTHSFVNFFSLLSEYCWVRELGNDMLERMCKKVVMAYFKVLFQYLPGTTVEHYENSQSR